MRKVLGVDVGGVIIDKTNDRTDTSFFGPNFLQTTAVPGVFEALRTLGDFEIHLVSKCGPGVQAKTRLWLAHHQFFERTGIRPERLHFCLTRPEKAPICTTLGVTHFVDDRLDVLDYLVDVPNLYLFQPNDRDAARYQRQPQRARMVGSWAEIVELMRQAATR